EALAVHLAAKVLQLFLAEAALDKGARINPGGAVALEIHQITKVAVVAAAEEIIEADIVEGGGGGEGGDMAAEAVLVLVGPHHHGQGIPADQGANSPLHKEIAGHALFPGGGNGVAKRGGDGVRGGNTLRRRPIEKL